MLHVEFFFFFFPASSASLIESLPSCNIAFFFFYSMRTKGKEGYKGRSLSILNLKIKNKKIIYPTNETTGISVLVQRVSVIK
jgi:hypothetical protein